MYIKLFLNAHLLFWVMNLTALSTDYLENATESNRLANKKRTYKSSLKEEDDVTPFAKRTKRQPVQNSSRSFYGEYASKIKKFDDEILYKIFSNNTPNFSDGSLGPDQKARLLKLCALPYATFNNFKIETVFKLAYYAMQGYRSDELCALTDLQTLVTMSSIRAIAYKEGILTAEEFIHSGGKIESMKTSGEEVAKALYNKYADATKDFDENFLDDDQKKRLLQLCDAPPKSFTKGKQTTFKVAYWVMRGKHHDEIQKLLNLETFGSISMARSEAYKQGFLTKEEAIQSGMRNSMKKTKRKN